MPEYARVKTEAGHEVSLPVGSFDPKEVTVLDKPATNAGGDPLPTKHKTSVSTEATKSKTPAKQAATDKE